MRTSSFIIFLILAVLLAGFVGTLAYFTFQPPVVGRGKASPMATGEALPPGIQSPSRPIISSSDPVRGNPNAPLAIVEFGDFVCPACAEVEPTLRKILAEYPSKVKLIWKDLPNTRRHPLAQKAAEAARCAGAQNKFWEYHDLLFQNQEKITDEIFGQFAHALNLHVGAFEECLSSGQLTATVERTFNEGILLRVDATPYFFIGDKRFSGALSEQELKDAIDLYGIRK